MCILASGTVYLHFKKQLTIQAASESSEDVRDPFCLSDHLTIHNQMRHFPQPISGKAESSVLELEVKYFDLKSSRKLSFKGINSEIFEMNTVALIYLGLFKCILFGYVTAMGKYRNLSYNLLCCLMFK